MFRRCRQSKAEAAKHGNNRHDGLIDVDATNQRSIEPQKVQQEAPNRINDQVDQEEIAFFQTIREIDAKSTGAGTYSPGSKATRKGTGDDNTPHLDNQPGDAAGSMYNFHGRFVGAP